MMKVTWDTLDAASWDAHHARAAAALQQDWAYGATMRLLGVPVLREVQAWGVPTLLTGLSNPVQLLWARALVRVVLCFHVRSR